MMKLIRYDDADAFDQHVEASLLPHETENNLIFGILGDVRAGRYNEHPNYMAAVEDEGAAVLVALRTPPHNQLLSYTETPEAIALVAEDAYAFYGSLPGVVTLSANAKTFTEHWMRISGCAAEREMAERIYRLEHLNTPQSIPGSARYITEADRELVIRWEYEFELEAFGEADEEAARKRIAWRYANQKRERNGLMLWVVDGEPASLAGYTGRTPNGMRVGPVYTPKELRGRGYGSAITAAVTQTILDLGCKSLLPVYRPRQSDL